MDKEERVGARLHTKVEISFLCVEEQPRNYLSFGECFLLIIIIFFNLYLLLSATYTEGGDSSS